MRRQIVDQRVMGEGRRRVVVRVGMIGRIVREVGEVRILVRETPATRAEDITTTCVVTIARETMSE